MSCFIGCNNLSYMCVCIPKLQFSSFQGGVCIHMLDKLLHFMNQSELVIYLEPPVSWPQSNVAFPNLSDLKCKHFLTKP